MRRREGVEREARLPERTREGMERVDRLPGADNSLARDGERVILGRAGEERASTLLYKSGERAFPHAKGVKGGLGRRGTL